MKPPYKFSEIDEALSVSSEILSEHVSFLKAQGVNTLIGLQPLASRFKETMLKQLKDNHIRYAFIPYNHSLYEQYQKILSAMHGKTVVHCGHSVSASHFAVAHLIHRGHSIQQAVELVRKKTGLGLYIGPEYQITFMQLRKEFLEKIRQTAEKKALHRPIPPAKKKRRSYKRK